MSGSVFWGWHTDIDMDDMNSIEDIIKKLKDRMLSWIEKVERVTEQDDLYGLRCSIEDIKFHFHEMKFGDLLLCEEQIIYICDHDHEAA